MIAMIDYKAGNIESVRKAFAYVGAETTLTENREEILAADAVVLPGVGAFGDAMARLRGMGLDRVVREAAGSGKPFLGICLGLQLLFEKSDEAPGVPGLGIFSGSVLRIPAGEGLKIPHIGWNSLTFHGEDPVFSSCKQEPYVYFVHSYYLHASDRTLVTASAEYGVSMDAAIRCNNVRAFQFHPEKSGEEGLSMLRNFCKEIGRV